MKHVLPVVALLTVGVATLSACGAGAAAPAPSSATGQATVSAGNTKLASDDTLPAALRVPAGQKLVLDAHVEAGSQVYTCTNGAWTLLEPAAALRSGNTVLLHTKGPEWISTADGSAVTGAAIATVPTPGAVPELLLKSTANRGTGTLGAVDFVQRLNTKGGVAPAGSCAGSELKAVAYSAEYRFYAPEH
jgi:uncharacterized protein DUF3455